MDIYNLEVEMYLLAGILRHPDTFPEIDNYIVQEDFSTPLHRTIFIVIRDTLRNKEKLDKVLIAEKIERYALSFEDKISSVLDYLNNITLHQIKESVVKETAKRLKSISLRRKLDYVGQKISNEMHKTQATQPEKIVASVDHIYSEVINAFTPENEPVDLFKGAEPYIQSLDNDEPSEEIVCPYSIYQRFFGGFFPGDLTLFASPPKSGKSSLLLDLLIKTSHYTNENIRGLIIDTELETYRVIRRMISAMSGVGEYMIRSKKWRKNEELSVKIQAALKETKKYFEKIDHIYVGNVTTEQMASIVRRWAWKKKIEAKKNKTPIKLIAAIDYFKLTGIDRVNDAFGASMNLGYRVDTFKKLASELQIPIIGACQTNRTTSEAGLSYEINKFVSSLFLFQRKTPEELARDGIEARHKLVPLYTRDLGEYSQGVNDLVKVPGPYGKPTWTENYIGFQLENFVVKEIGDLKSIHKSIGHLTIIKKNRSEEEDELM